MISAVIYNSKTGSCKKYAQMISAKLAVPCYPMGCSHVRAGGQVAYVSWVMAGKVVGYETAAKVYDVVAVAAVGMAPASAGSASRGREANKVPENVGFFSLQGGFNIHKLPLPLRLIMKVKTKDIAKQLRLKKDKAPLTAQEEAMYNMARRGVGEPAEWNVDESVAWLKAN